MWKVFNFLFLSSMTVRYRGGGDMQITPTAEERNFIDPHFAVGHEGIVHLFEWKWLDIAAECESFLGPSGFGGVQISPPNENVIIKGRPWYERYQPISYKLITRSGNEREFLEMTRRCNAVGVRIYVDVVFNHMAADQPTEIANGTAGSKADPQKRDYSAVPYTYSNFHPPCPLNDFNDIFQVRNCELVGLHDLNQTREDTRDKIVGYLNHLIRLGVAGFRVDAAKHQWPNDLRIIYNRLDFLNQTFGFAPKVSPFIYQEVIDMGDSPISKYEYTFAAVTEFRYSIDLSRAFSGNDDLKWLSGFGEAWDLLPSQFGVVFICNHDNQRANDGTLTYKMRKHYVMAQAFSLAHPYGIKKIMSSFDFNSTSHGPPMNRNEEISSPTFNAKGQCDNGWVCEHRWHEIAAMVEFANAVNGENVTSWWDNGKNQIAFSRGSKGFIVFNLEVSSDMENLKIPTGMQPGRYCDVISGAKISDSECSGKILEVSSENEIEITLKHNDPNGVIATHQNQKLLM